MLRGRRRGRCEDSFGGLGEGLWRVKGGTGCLLYCTFWVGNTDAIY